MRSHRIAVFLAAMLLTQFATAAEPLPAAKPSRLEPVHYNNPGLVVDLGVGLWAWPLPMDYDRDGDLDLVVSCPDKPYNGTYFFENPGKSSVQSPVSSATKSAEANDTGHSTLDTQPIFKPAVRIADGPTNVQVCYIDSEPVVMTPAKIYADFRADQYSKPIKLPLPEKLDPQYKRYRANQWKLLDWEGDGDIDVIAGIEIWDDYGWDDAWDAEGNWKNGPLHGFVYLVENLGGKDQGSRIQDSGDSPQNAGGIAASPLAALATAKFAEPRKLTTADGNPIDVYGMPSPSFADYDGDGDLDLICGEFLDGFTWFENTGSDAAKSFASGRRLIDPEALSRADCATPLLRMDLQMITPSSIDWDQDGCIDLICGDEDGRVALIRNRGENLAGELGPAFNPPVYFQQEAADVKFGALVAPFGVDWDGDGDDDIIAGNTAGYIGLIENLDGAAVPKFAAPRLLDANNQGSNSDSRSIIREQAGPKGSIQGPCEAKWGYSTLTVTDWNSDQRLDIVTNGIWGRVQTWFYRSSATPQLLSTPEAAYLAWTGESPPKAAWTWWTPGPGELATQWRTTPCAVDWNADGLTDLVMLDPEGFLAFYERTHADHGILVLKSAQRRFKITGPCEFDQKHNPVGDKKGDLLRLNANRAGASGRRKLHVVDWDGDGRLDLLVNSINVNWLRNVRTDDEGYTWFTDMGQLDDRVLAGHDTAPASVDWDQNGIPDLLVGAEDGRLYFKRNPRTEPTEIEHQKLKARSTQTSGE